MTFEQVYSLCIPLLLSVLVIRSTYRDYKEYKRRRNNRTGASSILRFQEEQEEQAKKQRSNMIRKRAKEQSEELIN